ncbi:hypothetical protein FRC10_009889 [Ceratobasidium sp. 414]|nr:hypothetical protein FRC10_009889 [Ceratobasidium sp. 414]
MDSFPTDGASELSLSLDEGDDRGFGVPESVSLGAFPVFLLQESPGSRKSSTSANNTVERRSSHHPSHLAVPQFPESPESSYGFSPAVAHTSPHTRLQLLGTTSRDFDLEPRRHRPSDSWDSQLSTPTRPPRYETQSRLLSAKPSLLDFAQSEEDETLVGHHDAAVVGHYDAAPGGHDKKLRPVLSFSSTTSTALASPLSDTFSPGPGSTSCSVSTSVSGSSWKSPCIDEFPTEVGGMASLDLDEPDRKIFTGMAGELVNNIASPLTIVQPNLQLGPTLEQQVNSPLLVSDIHTPPRTSLKHAHFAQSRPHAPKSSASSPIDANHRRAFSGARELVEQAPSSLGRLRSCSVNSDAAKRDLIEQAARSRSRSNSVSASASLARSSNGPARTLNSMQSKESFRTKFANLPGYVTFLRETTLEIWIDQEGFRAIRPQFELHRYTPGQLTPVTPNLRLGASPKSPKSIRPRSAQPPMTPPRKAGEELRRPSTSDSVQRVGSSLSPAQTSPVASRFSPAPESKPVEDLRTQFLENWGVAEFTMKKRRGWNFHHGMAEGEPNIRRLTINGREDRDYLSREASLSVRSNGVYTVKGSQDHGRFLWKFEYLVEDRRGPTGAIIQGEKVNIAFAPEYFQSNQVVQVLTPLTFSCAPELLIPEQGKKVGLLRVMKKSVIPKISASKLDPVLIFPVTPGGNTSSTEEHAHSGKGKTFETLAKIVRPSSHSKSRPAVPTPPRRLPASLGVHRTTDRLEGVTEDGHRRAASYSSMRPDLKQILGDDG